MSPPPTHDERVHAATVHGCSAFAERYGSNTIPMKRRRSREERPKFYGATVHGGRRFNRYMWDSESEHTGTGLGDLDDDVLLHLGHQHVGAAALLAQCDTRLHQLFKTHLAHALVQLEEVGTVGDAKRHGWVRQVHADEAGSVHLLCHGARECVLLEYSMPQQWPLAAAIEVRCVPSGSLSNPFSAGACGTKVLTTDRSMHVVRVCEGGVVLKELQDPSMQHPSAVTSDGVHAFVCASSTPRSSTVYVFEMMSGACVATWPATLADGRAFLCETGIAVHLNELYIVDQRGASVHVFSLDGEHQRSFGKYGTGPGCFRQPWGVASCGEHIIVSELAGRRLQVFTPDGHPRGMLSPPGCGELAGICVQQSAAVGSGDAHQASSTVLVADWDRRCARVLRIDPWY